MRNASETKVEARKALGDNGQYLRYLTAYLLVVVTALILFIPVFSIIGIGIGVSGISPFLAPGGQPEIGLFADPNVMLPLAVSFTLFSLLFMYPLGFVKWGESAMSIATIRRGLTVGHAFSGWGHGWKMGWIEMVKITYLSLWYLLLVVPGMVKSLSYAMTEFIAVDHPEWDANQCISESRRLMDGHKIRYLCMLLSFTGWIILLIFVGYVPFVGGMCQWLFIPYIAAAKAAFYEELLDIDAAQCQ